MLKLLEILYTVKNKGTEAVAGTVKDHNMFNLVTDMYTFEVPICIP